MNLILIATILYVTVVEPCKYELHTMEELGTFNISEKQIALGLKLDSLFVRVTGQQMCPYFIRVGCSINSQSWNTTANSFYLVLGERSCVLTSDYIILAVASDIHYLSADVERSNQTIAYISGLVLALIICLAIIWSVNQFCKRPNPPIIENPIYTPLTIKCGA